MTTNNYSQNSKPDIFFCFQSKLHNGQRSEVPVLCFLLQVPCYTGSNKRETHTYTHAHIQKHWQRDGDNKQALNENTITGSLIPSASSSAKRLFFSFFESPNNREQRRERERERKPNLTQWQNKTQQKGEKKNRFQVKQQPEKKPKGKRTNETYLLLASLKVPWFTTDQRNQATAMNEFLSGLCFPETDFLPCPSLPPHYYPHKQICRTCFEQQTEDSSSLLLFRKKRSRFSSDRERESERIRVCLKAFSWKKPGFPDSNCDAHCVQHH